MPLAMVTKFSTPIAFVLILSPLVSSWKYKCNQFYLQDGLCPGTDGLSYAICDPNSQNVVTKFNWTFSITEQNGVAVLNTSKLSSSGNSDILPASVWFYQSLFCNGDPMANVGDVIGTFNDSFGSSKMWKYPSYNENCIESYYEFDYQAGSATLGDIASDFLSENGLFWHDKYGALVMPGQSVLYGKKKIYIEENSPSKKVYIS